MDRDIKLTLSPSAAGFSHYSMSPTDESIRAENERLKQEIEALKQEITLLLTKLAEKQAVPGLRPASSSTEMTDRAALLLRRLPEPFTVDDLIDASEKIGVNIFKAYQDFQVLVKSQLLLEEDGVFSRTPLLLELFDI